jgi:hypothetical protein
MSLPHKKLNFVLLAAQCGDGMEICGETIGAEAKHQY